MRQERQDELSSSRKRDPDPVTMILRSAAGRIQFSSSLLVELAGLVIRDRKVERLEAYVRHLGLRLNAMNAEELSQKLQIFSHIDLFEQGALQTIQAASPERRRFIAELVASGIIGRSEDSIEARNFLRVLIEIDDADVALLFGYLKRNIDDRGHFKSHGASAETVRDEINENKGDLDRIRLPEQLQVLGLLSLRPLAGGQHEMSHPGLNGAAATRSFDLSDRGRTLLVRIGLASPQDI